MKKKILPFIVVLLGICSINGQLITNDFMTGLDIGDDIEKGVYNETTDPVVLNQWNNLASYASSDPNLSPKVVAPLSFTGYIDSEASNAIALEKLTSGTRISMYSLDESAGTLYGQATSSVYYLAFMLNVSEVAENTNGIGILSFNGSANGNFLRGAFAIKRVIDDRYDYIVGVSNVSGSNAKTNPAWRKYNETNVYVVRFDFANSKIGFFVPTAAQLSSLTEPAVAASENLSGHSAHIRSIAIFQNANFSATIGGLRFGRSWADIAGIYTGFNDFPQENKSIIKEQYFTPAGVEVAVPVERNIYIKKTTYEDGAMKSDKMFYLKR